MNKMKSCSYFTEINKKAVYKSKNKIVLKTSIRSNQLFLKKIWLTFSEVLFG